MASEKFANKVFAFEAVAADEKECYWESAADVYKRVWFSPRERAACMCRPTPGFLCADGRPGNLFSDGERGVDFSPTYQVNYSTLSRVAARSRALSLANEVRPGVLSEPPRSGEDLRPAVGRTDDGGWIYTGGWDDDLRDRPSARTLSAFTLTGFAQVNDADPEYDPDEFVHVVVPDIQLWWAGGAQLLNGIQHEYRKGDAEFKALIARDADSNHLDVHPEHTPRVEPHRLVEACPSSSSRRRKRKAKRAREQRRLLNISPASWDQRLSAQQVGQPASIQDIFKEMSFDPDEPLDLRGALLLRERGV